MAHKWQPIKDLDDSFNENVHEELHHLADIWQDQKNEFNLEQIDDFILKIKREWSIETGLVEGIYDLDRGVTETLIKHGIREDRVLPGKGDSSARVAAVLHDHEHVIDDLFDFIKDTRELSVNYIKKLHEDLLQNQPTTTAVDQFGKANEIQLLRGKFKKHPNNPRTKSGEIHQYCPPVQVGSEMDNLITMHKTHVKKKYPPLAMAAWLHHRFVQIHPFQDGNGRVARCLATLVFIKAGWFPLVIRKNEEREPYINALEVADAGNLSPLINLFATAQKRYFLNASGIAQDIAQEETPITAIIKSVARKLKERRDQVRGGDEAKEIANQLLDSAYQRMEEICSETRQELGDAVNIIAERYNEEDTTKSAIGRFESIIQHTAAVRYNYYPNTNAHTAWTKMEIKTMPIVSKSMVSIASNPPTNILVFFQGIGQEYRGVIVCFAYVNNEKTEQLIGDEVFQINYKEPLEETQKRFEEWLDKVMPECLRIWHDGL